MKDQITDHFYLKHFEFYSVSSGERLDLKVSHIQLLRILIPSPLSRMVKHSVQYLSYMVSAQEVSTQQLNNTTKQTNSVASIIK